MVRDQGPTVKGSSAYLNSNGKGWETENKHMSARKKEDLPALPATMTPPQRQAAKREIVRDIEQGVSAREARVRRAVPMHRTTVSRLRKRVQREGDNGFADGRHGHPVKLRGEVLTLVCEYCQANACVPSPAVQRLLQERFGICISISQLNRVRASLGLSR